MIKLTHKAINAYNKEKLGFNGDPMLKIEVAGIGWGGPSFKIVLDELYTRNNYVIEDVSGVKIAYDNSIKTYVNNTVIDYSNLWLIGGFYISGGKSGC